ncbi:MAG TPA: histidine phosphatase family protein, partial [Vicinamibacterales bacterium]|nr:histidine phosphatase family protein [Vicinamibacterales bacterium]
GIGASFLPVLGAIEIALAAALLARPAAGLLIAIAVWKVATESLFIAAGAPVWEFIERGGSYAAPLAAALLLRQRMPVMGSARVRYSAAATLALMVAAAGAVSAQTPASGLSPQLIDELRTGGLVVFCRHAITSHAREDRMPVDFSDPSTQRVLSPEGEQQAIAMGEAMKQLRIRFGVSLASPFQRTRQSAESIAGHVAIDESLSSMSRNRDVELRALVFNRVEPGSNRLLVTHQGLIYRVLQGLRRGSVAEGDCIIVRPSADGGEPLSHVKADDWSRAAKTP